MLNEKSIEIYSSRDKIREQLISLAKDYLQLENFDYSKSSYISYIINMLSYLDSNLIYYISSVYREQFLSKAIQRESVLNLANIIGYKPTLATPATCSVLIEIPYDSSSSKDRIIEFIGRNHDNSADDTDVDKPVFKVYSTDGIEFSLINTVIVDISRNNIVKVKQQVFLNDNVTYSTGSKTIEHRFVNGNIQFIVDFIQLVEVAQNFTIPELQANEFHNITYNFNKKGNIADIDLFLITTTTNGLVERWVRKESIFGIGPDEPAYTYRETGKGIVISFGNGVIGRQPKKGTDVIVSVGLSQGSNGNVIAGSIKRADSVRMVEDNGNNTSSIKYVQVRCINKEPSQFGSNPPTIDEVRSNAINKVSTNSRLVSHRDFENASLVVQNLPIRNVFQVLKRSDLKRNEISLFTELIYNNVVVPTRNANLSIDAASIADTTSHQIKAESTEIVIDDEVYVSLFDIFLNKHTNEVNYYYFMPESQQPVTILSTDLSNSPTKILPIFTSFITDRTSDPGEFIVEVHCNVLDTTSDYRCTLSVDWPTVNGSSLYELTEYTEGQTSDISSVKIFSTRDTPISLDTVPTGSIIEFTYTLYSDDTTLNTSTNSIIVKKDLSDFMYSQVHLKNGFYNIYDIPVIKKDYYTNLVNKGLFTTSILNKIIDFDIYEYRMVTDFVNLKFANTTGISSNMKYRSITKQSVIDINPITIPENPLNQDRYAFSSTNNPWTSSGLYPNITTGGYIAFYNTSTSSWGFEKLKINDIFDVTNLNNINSGLEEDDEDWVTYRMIYTGRDIVEPKFSIPVDIRLQVIPSDALTVSDQVLVRTIKDTLVTKLSPNFGYNKTLLRSVIIKTVQDIPGVEHVELIKPEFNIKFEADPYKNMTQEQLLRYTPELVFFSTENIIVEIKDE